MLRRLRRPRRCRLRRRPSPQRRPRRRKRLLRRSLLHRRKRWPQRTPWRRRPAAVPGRRAVRGRSAVLLTGRAPVAAATPVPPTARVPAARTPAATLLVARTVNSDIKTLQNLGNKSDPVPWGTHHPLHRWPERKSYGRPKIPSKTALRAGPRSRRRVPGPLPRGHPPSNSREGCGDAGNFRRHRTLPANGANRADPDRRPAARADPARDRGGILRVDHLVVVGLFKLDGGDDFLGRRGRS